MKPIAKFYRLVPSAPPIVAADATLDGSLPVRAVQYCDPVVSACGFGWHVRPPVDFALLFDGRSFLVSFNEGAAWHPLDECQIPGLRADHQRGARHEMAETLPPFLAALQESGIVQMWSGYFAATRRHWALSIGGVVNRFSSSAFDCMEGIVETDWWSGPLFTNLIFRQTNRPVFFSRRDPIFQVRPVLKSAYAKATRESAEVMLDADSFPDAAWRDYVRSATRDGTGSDHKGWYAKCARQARR